MSRKNPRRENSEYKSAPFEMLVVDRDGARVVRDFTAFCVLHNPLLPRFKIRRDFRERGGRRKP